MRYTSVTAAVCAALFLSSCSLLHKRAGKTPPTGEVTAPAATNKGDDAPAPAAPTAEQQAAARQLLEEGAITAPIMDEGLYGPATDSTASPYGTGGIPGGRGLRMGNLAAPEEAASTTGNATPKPNSVELRGLRSPSLPKGLPMDINGKLTPASSD